MHFPDSRVTLRTRSLTINILETQWKMLWEFANSFVGASKKIFHSARNTDQFFWRKRFHLLFVCDSKPTKTKAKNDKFRY